MSATEKADAMLKAYIDCAFWSSDNKEGKSLESLGDLVLSREAYDIMVFDLINFLSLVREKGIAWQGFMTEMQFGHDFWLTRNWHDAGFWDRGLGELGDKLTECAKAYGECSLYIGDNGKVYCDVK